MLELQRTAGNRAVASAVLGSTPQCRLPLVVRAALRVPVQRSAGLGEHLPAIDHSMGELVRDWKKYANPTKLVTELTNRANSFLKQAGVPKVEVVLEKAGSSAAAFTPAGWTMKVSVPNEFGPQGGTSSPMEAFKGHLGSLADSVFHEARHAEQFFLLAREFARRFPDIKLLDHSLTAVTGAAYPGGVLKSAVKNPLTADDERRSTVEKYASEAKQVATAGTKLPYMAPTLNAVFGKAQKKLEELTGAFNENRATEEMVTQAEGAKGELDKLTQQLQVELDNYFKSTIEMEAISFGGGIAEKITGKTPPPFAWQDELNQFQKSLGESYWKHVDEYFYKVRLKLGMGPRPVATAVQPKPAQLSALLTNVLQGGGKQSGTK